MTYTDGSGRSEQMPQMLDCWRYKELETLVQRRKLVAKYNRSYFC
ncbi:MAG: hypothetical protein ACLUD2_06910 [Clostridium sp.]